MDSPGTVPLADTLRRLRMQADYGRAREAIRQVEGFETSPALQRLLHEHEDFWWQPIKGRRVTLRRRCEDDAPLVRACWADAEFMRKLNRAARPLPARDDALRQILARERASIVSEAKSLHWTIHAGEGPLGFASATEISAGHRRCEFLVGLLGQAASPRAVEAAWLAVDFLRERVAMERLTAYFYADNSDAAKVAEKFGFRPEGVLRGYIRSANGSRADLMVSGLAIADAARDNRVWARYARARHIE
jgi:RimJ/RimL family protein N-acetyltransferase